MTDRYAGRLTILEDQEIDELYGLPRFTLDERVHFFTPSLDERDVADRHHTLANRVLFILQAGYFKAKKMFFSFEFDEVWEDVWHVLRQHYPLHQDDGLRAPISSSRLGTPNSGRSSRCTAIAPATLPSERYW